MGRITAELLDVLEIYHQEFPTRKSEIDEKLDSAFKHIHETSLPSAFLLKKGMVEDFDVGFPSTGPGIHRGRILHGKAEGTGEIARKQAVIEVAANLKEDELLVSTTGKISRELFDFADRASNFYMQGSMGYAASIGLGLALGQKKKVVVLDGDGAALMKMGTLATVGYYQPGHFTHIILDNQSYDTTGGQRSVSPVVSFPEVAVACGYQRAITVCSQGSLGKYLNRFLGEKGPSLLHVKVKKGADKNLGRPTLSPEEIKDRFVECINE